MTMGSTSLSTEYARAFREPLSSFAVFRKCICLVLLFAGPLFLHSQSEDFPFRYKVWGGSWMPLDTNLNVDELFAQEPLLDDAYGFLPLGNQGSWRQNLIFHSELIPETHFGNRAFDQHFRHPDRWKYFDVRAALTEADYRQGYERGQKFRLFHTQNVHERLNFFFEFNRLNSLGAYQRQQVEQSDVLLTLYYTTKDGQYAFHGGVNTGTIKMEANGGLLYDSVFTENSITDRSIVPVVSLTGEQQLRNRSMVFDQSFRIINRSQDSTYSGWLEKLQVDHRFSYLRQSYVYRDFPGTDTPPPNLQNNITEDSTHFERVENSLGVSLEGALDLGASLWLSSSSNEGVNYRSVQNNLGIRAHMTTVVADRFPLRLRLNYVLGGDRQGGLDLFAETGFSGKKFRFLPYLRITRALPGFQWYRYTSNYKAWNRTYEMMTRSELGLRMELEKAGELKVRLFRWDRPVYFDTIISPKQAEEASNYLSVSWNSTYRWGILNWNNRICWQETAQDDLFLRLPSVYTRQSLHLQFYLFDRVLEMQPGLAFTWFSNYRMRAYDPYANVFYNQQTQQLGDFPLLDLFLNMRLGRAEFYLEFEHLNSFFSPTDYWAAPGYPLPDYFFRAGINWRFFN